MVAPLRSANHGTRTEELNGPPVDGLFPGPAIGTRGAAIALAAILLAAAALRLGGLGTSPPGLNQDEAVIAWNSWCLLKTGTDAAGQSWPIFYCHALGVPHDMLSIYALMPFQVLGGLNTVTTRLPAAVGGVLTVLLAYFVGARLFGRWTGLAAAALLTLNPWHIQQCRWGHEAPLCPLVVTLSIAMLLWANLPFLEDPKRKPRIVLSFFAGAMVGISCYGYAAIKLFFPAFLLLAGAATIANWWRAVKTPRGAAAIGAMFLGLAVTFGPLVHRQLTDPGMGARGETTFIWKQVDEAGVPISKPAAVGQVLERYVSHFLPDWLFVRGDHYVIQGPPDHGEFYWYDLPLLVLGVVFMVPRLRRSSQWRFLLAFVLAYPVPDILSVHSVAEGISMHALRSLPGIVAMALLSAVGLVGAGIWLAGRNRSLAKAAAAAFVIVVALMNASYLQRFYGEFNDKPEIYHRYHVDLLKACDYLRPRMKDYDAVFCTTRMMNTPFIVTLVGLQYDPKLWFQQPPTMQKIGEWDHCLRYGKMNFLEVGLGRNPSTGQTQAVPMWDWPKMINDFNHNGKKAAYVVRPGEDSAYGIVGAVPVERIHRPDNAEVLWVCEKK